MEIKTGLEELWAKGQVKSDWILKKFTLEDIQKVLSALPKKYCTMSEFLVDQQGRSAVIPEAIDQEPSREWCSLLGITNKAKAVAIEKYCGDAGITPGWVSANYCLFFCNHVRNVATTFRTWLRKKSVTFCSLPLTFCL